MKKLYDYHGNKEELFKQILKQKNSIKITKLLEHLIII